MKYPPTINVQAVGLADAYYQLIKACMTEGAQKKRDYGNTLDIISLTKIRQPLLKPMLHPQFPTKELHMQEYEKQWERGYDWRKQGFEYNYMDRLINYPRVTISVDSDKYENSDYYRKADIRFKDEDFIDQLEVIRENIAKRIESGGECLVSNREQAITWIPDRDLFVAEDQPCLQRVWLQVFEYPFISNGIETVSHIYKSDLPREHKGELVKGKATFHIMWRSRDLYGAWNSNMVGLIKMIIREALEPNNLQLIEVVDFCNSLHIYELDWEAAKLIKPIAVNPMMMGR